MWVGGGSSARATAQADDSNTQSNDWVWRAVHGVRAMPLDVSQLPVDLRRQLPSAIKPACIGKAITSTKFRFKDDFSKK